MTASLQMQEPLTATSGAYGTAPYGTAPYGGNLDPAVDLVTFHLGSDEIAESRHRIAADIVHYRLGLPVSVRPWTIGRRWHCNYNVTTEAVIDALQPFFNIRVFNLLQTGDPGSAIEVYWMDTVFRPIYLAPDAYSLSFTLGEVIS